MVQKYIFRLMDFLFPLNCSLCGEYDLFSSKLSICKKCLKEKKQIRKADEQVARCNICKSELSEKDCNYCNSRNVFFSNLLFLRIKGDFEKEIIRKIKFGSCPYLSNYFRLGFRKFIPYIESQKYSGVVTIPSNRHTNRKRPFFVCKPITTFLEEKINLKILNVLEKKSNDLQSGKSFRDRFLHAQSAFSIKKKYTNSLTGNYLLVDDVFTTGATINEIAKLLIQSGAARVDILVLVKGKM
jgi:competence protein ComFC